MDNVGVSNFYRVMIGGEILEDIKSVNGLHSSVEVRRTSNPGSSEGDKLSRGEANKSGTLSINFLSSSKASNYLWKWYDSIRNLSNQKIDRKNIVIELLTSDDNKAFLTFKLTNAWPCQWTGPSLSQNSEGLALESIDIVFETINREEEG